MSDLPSGWQQCQLKNLLAEPIRNGYSPVCPKEPTGKWMLHLGAVSAGGYNRHAVKPAPANDPGVDEAMLSPGDILVSRSNTRERVGLAGIYDGDPTPCSYPDLLMRVRVKFDVDRQFLTYTLLSEAGRSYFQRCARGTSGSMLKIDRGILEGFPVSLPPLPEQRKIAAVLSSIDDAIERTESAATQIGVLREELLRDLLSEEKWAAGVGVPAGTDGSSRGKWAVQLLGDVADFDNGRAFNADDWGKEGLPIIRIQNLNGGTEFNYFGGQPDRRDFVDPGDLLFSWSGSRGTSFGPFIWNGPRGVLNQHIFNVRNLRLVSKPFLYWVLSFLVERIEEQAHGAAGLVHIKKSELKAFRVPVPPPSEQNRISMTLDSNLQAEEANGNLLRALRDLKVGLSAALLSGELRVTPDEATT